MRLFNHHSLLLLLVLGLIMVRRASAGIEKKNNLPSMDNYRNYWRSVIRVSFPYNARRSLDRHSSVCTWLQSPTNWINASMKKDLGRVEASSCIPIHIFNPLGNVIMGVIFCQVNFTEIINRSIKGQWLFPLYSTLLHRTWEKNANWPSSLWSNPTTWQIT